MPVLYPDLCYYELRAVGRMRRSVVHVADIAQNMKNIGSRPTDVHISVCRYGADLKKYKDTHGKVKNFRGLAYSSFIPIEIDPPKKDSLREMVATSIQSAISIASHISAKIKVPVDAFKFFFSGGKSIHLMIPTALFGELSPSENFHMALRDIVVELLEGTEWVYEEDGVWIGKYIDFALFSSLSLIRMPHTLHPKRSLWKVPLTFEDLERGVDHVEHLAERDRYLNSDERFSATNESLALGEIVEERIRSDSFRTKDKRKIDHFDSSPISLIDFLTSMEEKGKPGFGMAATEGRKLIEVLKGGLAEGESVKDLSGRNDALCYLVGTLKSFKLPLDVSMLLLHHWNQSLNPPISSDEFMSVFNSLYSD